MGTVYTIKLQEHSLNDLKIFLDRVTLTGKEVMAYNILIKAIYEAEKIEGTTKEVGD